MSHCPNIGWLVAVPKQDLHLLPPKVQCDITEPHHLGKLSNLLGQEKRQVKGL